MSRSFEEVCIDLELAEQENATLKSAEVCYNEVLHELREDNRRLKESLESEVAVHKNTLQAYEEARRDTARDILSAIITNGWGMHSINWITEKYGLEDV